MYKLFSYLVLVLVFVACTKVDREIMIPVISTEEVMIEGSTENGVTFSATAILKGQEMILEKGFVYGEYKELDVETGTKLLFTDGTSNNFSIKLTDVIKPNVTYFVRSYIKTAYHIIYGNTVSFFSTGSKPPVIEKIEPELAFWGDTIKLIGKNFDVTGEYNKVYFGNFEAQKIWGSVDTIYAVIPTALNVKSSEVNVNTYGKNSENSKRFEIYSPVVHSISKTEGQYPETIIIKGDYFSSSINNPLKAKLTINNETYQVGQVLNRNEIQLTLPFIGLNKGGSCSLEIIQLGKSVWLNNFFTCKQQAIELHTKKVTIGQLIQLNTQNLDLSGSSLMVKVNDYDISSYALKTYPDYLEFPAWGGSLDDVSFSIELFLDNSSIYSATIEQAGPIIGEIYNAPIPMNGTMEFDAIGVSLSPECIMQWENPNGIQYETQVSPYYNRVPRNYQFRAKTILSDDITPGEYRIRLFFHNRYSEWKTITINDVNI